MPRPKAQNSYGQSWLDDLRPAFRFRRLRKRATRWEASTVNPGEIDADVPFLLRPLTLALFAPGCHQTGTVAAHIHGIQENRMPAATLIFVYNANGGLFSAMADAAHKLISPATYPCSLCAITYGAVSMRGEWKSYLKRLPHDTRFYHRDDFARDWPDEVAALPAIFVQTGPGALAVLAAKQDLDKVQSVVELMDLLDERLARVSSDIGGV